MVSLESEDLVAAFKEACGGDGPTLVIDPVWGEPVAAATAAAPGARLVNIGQSAGPAAPFLSADVRGKQLNILGYSNFGTPREVMHREYLRLVEHAKVGDIEVEIKTFRSTGLPRPGRRRLGAPGQGRRRAGLGPEA